MFEFADVIAEGWVGAVYAEFVEDYGEAGDGEAFEEAAGEWRLDQLDPRAWRARVAWVPQDPVLQHGTVESNTGSRARRSSWPPVARRLETIRVSPKW